jgi:hypothetical protein
MASGTKGPQQQILFSDDFERDPESLEDGEDWELLGGDEDDFVIEDGEVNFLNNGLQESAVACPDAGTSDHWASAIVGNVVNSTACFACVRMIDEVNYTGMRWRADGGGIGWEGVMVVDDEIASINETDTSALPAVALGQEVLVEAIGDTFRGYVDGELVLTWTIDEALAAATRAGFVTRGSATENAKVRSFRAGRF